MAPPIAACSLPHLKIIASRKGNVEMPTKLSDNENTAVFNSVEAIGQYLDELGITDMATMSLEQICDFLAFGFGTICDERSKLWADGIPV